MSKLCAVSALLLSLAIVFTNNAHAQTRSVTCSGTITSPVQTALTAAIDGDIIDIGAGSCSLGNVSWTNKNITFRGQGIDVTTLTFLSANTIVVNATTKASFRITGFTANLGSVDNSGSIQLIDDTTTEQKGFRVDHIKFVTIAASASGMHRPIQVQGLLYGVVDSCIFNMNHATAGNSIDPFLNSEWPGILGGTSWNKPLGLGTDNAVYFEDNTFTFTSGAHLGGGAFAIDGAYGMRLVFRHNTINDGYLMTHWYESGSNRRGPLKNEIYENTFIGSSGASNYLLRPLWLLGGTGVLYNNTISGAGWTGKNFQFEDRNSCTGACTTWPCPDQIGRGGGNVGSQTAIPFYVWNNSVTVVLQGDCANPSLQSANLKNTPHSNGQVDYCEGTTTMPASCGTHTNTYSSYTYPHPLIGGGGDTTPPTVSITVPTAGATVSGASQSVTATASDNIAVSSVQFKLDGVNLGSADMVAPYSIVWDTTTASNASHTITAVAIDSSGNSTTSTGITVYVSNGSSDTTPPTVSLTAPTSGVTVSGSTVSLSSTASDNVGVVGVQFKVDGVNVGAEDTVSPYSITWDSSTIANGNHLITAVARDAAGNTATTQDLDVNRITAFNTGASQITEARFAMMEAAGAKAVRFVIPWYAIEGTQGTYNWSSVDTIVSSLATHNLIPHGQLQSPPAWARITSCNTSSNCAPQAQYYANFATFAAAAVTRYPSIRVWEIFNEQNTDQFWKPAPDAAAYTALLQAAYTAMKNIDPTITVISGGTTVAGAGDIAPQTFLQSMYTAGAAGYMDGVGFHPYCYSSATCPSNSDANFSIMNNSNPSLRSIMTANGDAAKKIWVTEYGAPSERSILNEASQATLIQNYLTLLKGYSWLSPYSFLHKDTDDTALCLSDPNRATNIECFFGLQRYDGTYKPSYDVFYNTAHAGLSVTVANSGPALPDVIVTNITYNAGVFTATVKNIGTAATPTGVTIGVNFKVDGVTKTWTSSGSATLAPGQSGTYTSTGRGGSYIIPAGTHTIASTADDVNRFVESDETNNTLSQSITVSSSAPVITGITCDKTSIQPPNESTNCTETHNTYSGTINARSWTIKAGTGDKAQCTFSNIGNPSTLSCSYGGPVDICVILNSSDGDSDPFCTTNYIKSKYRKVTGLRVN